MKFFMNRRNKIEKENFGAGVGGNLSFERLQRISRKGRGRFRCRKLHGKYDK